MKHDNVPLFFLPLLDRSTGTGASVGSSLWVLGVEGLDPSRRGVRGVGCPLLSSPSPLTSDSPDMPLQADTYNQFLERINKLVQELNICQVWWSKSIFCVFIAVL